MPLATPAQYAEMLDAAKAGGYAYTRAVADHMFVNYAAVVRADCGVGDKRAYDPRTWGRSAEQAMAARIVEACHQLDSVGRSLTGHARRPPRA
jgi:fructose/tagatose bisphosphate aldolase